MHQNERCTCELCVTMKNPKTVHREQREIEGFQCHFIVMRDGRTRKYGAALLVEVGFGRAIHTITAFTAPRGVSEQDAVAGIIQGALVNGVVDDMLVGAREAWREAVDSPEQWAEEQRQDASRE